MLVWWIFKVRSFERNRCNLESTKLQESRTELYFLSFHKYANGSLLSLTSTNSRAESLTYSPSFIYGNLRGFSLFVSLLSVSAMGLFRVGTSKNLLSTAFYPLKELESRT